MIYECHVGTATPEGTYAGAAGAARPTSRRSASPPSSCCRSPTSRARATGATTASCPTRPTRAYGRPDDLKRLVDARPRARPDGLPRRGLQPLRPGRELPPRLRQDLLHRAPPDPLGRGHQLRRQGERRHGAATSSSRTPCTGWRSTTSTACASTPSTPSSTIRRDTSWPSSARRSAQAFPDRQIHLMLENEANQARWLERDAAGPAEPARRAVDRRPAPLLARPADRRGRRLLRELRRQAGRAPGPLPGGGLRLPGRAVRDPRQPPARRALRRTCRPPPS